MSSNGWVIDLHNVHKTYEGKIQALRGVDLQVGAGEIFGLLGPNGAGKSTLVKIMMTVVRPDQADGTLLARPLGHHPTLQRVGYLREGHRFPSYLSGRQVLDFYGSLSRVPRHLRRRRSDAWLERLGLAKWGDTRISRYSKGMLQRVGIAQALLHEPDLVVLDEPTDGVDPLGRRQIREILLELRRAGKTTLINSHILSELEMICDRVAILIDGRVTRQGTLEQLTAHSNTYVVTTATTLEPATAALLELGCTVNDRTVSVRGDDASAANRVIDVLRRHDILIDTVRRQRWSLEDVFLDAAGVTEP